MSGAVQNNLHIDNVVSSQPGLGPSPPDGGYGWVILSSAMITQLTIPSVIFSYGILIAYQNLQDENYDKPIYRLWNQNITLVPVLITIFSLLTTCWSRTIVKLSNRPRIVSISGVFLLTAGILLSSLGVDDEENTIIYNIFAGILGGFGTSLVMQQSEILLMHYFRDKLHIVQAIYKVSIIFGNILITLIMGAIFSSYDTRIGLFLYAGIIGQNCLILLVYSRPTYIIAPLQRNYKILQEAAEDEDEEIYPSQIENNTTTERSEVVRVEINVHGHSNMIDDEQDEQVISSFNAKNTKKQVIQPSVAAISRLEPSTSVNTTNFERDLTGYVYQNTESLYKETTVTNGNNDQNNIFTFDSPSMNNQSVKRTLDVRKNLIILISVMRDIRFYIYTYVNFCLRFSILILAIVFPAHVLQELTYLDMWSMAGLIMVVYMGAMCFNTVMAFLPSHYNKKFFLSIFNMMAFAGLFGIAESDSRTWFIVTGTLSCFAVYAIHVMQRDVYEEMRVERGKTIVLMVSNTIVATLILFIILLHNYSYPTCFKIAASMHLVVPIPLFIILKN